MGNTQNPLSGTVGLDTTDFKTAISSLNRDIRVIESGFRATAAGLGDWSKSASGVETRIKALNSEIDVQQKKVAALQSEYKRVAAEKGATSKAAQDLQIRLNNENATLGKMQLELVQSKTKLGELGKSSDDTGGKLESLKGKIGGVVGGLGHLAAEAGKVAAKLAVGVATSVAAVVVGLGALVVKTAGTADALAEMADKTGISTTRLQELAFIGEQTGTGVDTVTDAMAKLVRSMGTANEQQGKFNDQMGAAKTKADKNKVAMGDMQKAFADLGVSVTDANGNLRDNQDVFNDVITALGKIENPTERDAMAMQLFGKSAQELNPLINAGAEELAAMAAEAHKVGAVMSEEDVAAMAALNDRIATLKAGFMGLVAHVATAVLPIFDAIVSAVMAWLANPAIQAGFAAFQAWLGVQLPIAIQTLANFWTGVLQPAIQTVWTWMQTVLIPFLQNTVFPWLQVNIPAALQTLAVFWTNVLQPAIQAVWSWMQGTLIPFLQNTVFPWLQVNIPKALATLANFWTGTLQPAIQTVWAWMQSTLIPFLQNVVFPWLQVNIPKALKFLADTWTNVLWPAIQKIWQFLSVDMMPIWQALGNLIGVIVVTDIKILTGIWQNVLQPALAAIWDWIQNKVIPAFKSWWNSMTPVRDIISSIAGWIQTMADRLKNLKLPDWLTPGSPTPLELGLRGIMDVMGELNRITLPKLAANIQLRGQPAPVAAQAGAASVQRQQILIYGNIILPNVTDTKSLLEELNALSL